MKFGKRFFLSLLLAVAGCHSAGSITPEETGEMPYGLWGFAFFTPKALPALVTYVGIIDDKNILYSFRTLDWVQEDLSSIGHWDNRYMRFAQFNKARHPPVAMLFCWDSIIDKKTYETHIIFPASMREQMNTSTGLDWLGKEAWYSTILFGLAPEGKVKVWLQNSGGGDNLPVEPKKITTLSGDKLDGCKGITKHSKGYRYSKTTQEFIKDKTYPYGNW
ncbi:hypothetical protein F153LOC_21040 [Lelliottia sp. F153]|uniref:DUF2931 family protein n=1 Tax=unclassified Lelliottia TaxID=2642424 RepID=UPI000C7EEC3C|nr:MULTISPECIES: DUF2931 family protein [unclassified Lelliottia]PLY42308.1 hypothetical protein F159LOC_21460 [Lelliottia sp. F159]PLY49717.1 hypothetical protein F154LOC_14555 [Lelliottia sp. F154]PLY52838.1 hypothetical protein F153LOC_21040 [Lelliottia sp. F153]